MKRYRVLEMSFDTRALVLGEEILETWDESVKEQWRSSREGIAQSVIAEFGSLESERKLKDFVDFGVIPFSILAFHNRFFNQIRGSFVSGAYYPALTAACALGERILNHLLIELREEFRSSAEYKDVYRKKSFDNWKLPIQTLASWGVLLPEVTSAFRRLHDVRTRAIHFRPEVDSNDREIALEAIAILREIIDNQFGAHGNQPWFIKGTPGVTYLTQDATTFPFVQKFYVPRCRLVGPLHTLSFDENRRFIVHDDHQYPEVDVSDEEFWELRTSPRQAG